MDWSKINKLPAAEHRLLFSLDLLNHTLNHQPRFLPSALVLLFIAQQLQLKLTLICSSKLPFQLSSLEEELLQKKTKTNKNIANMGHYDSSCISNESKIYYHSTPQWQQLNQHRTIWSRMEFFFMYHYIFLSIFEEGQLSFYVAALLNSKRKEKERPGCGPELSCWGLPLPLARSSHETPGEADQGLYTA